MEQKIFLIQYNELPIAVCDSKENALKIVNENFKVNSVEERQKLENLKNYVILNKVSPKDNPEVNRQLYITNIEFNTYIE